MAKGGRKHASPDRRDRLLGTCGYDHGGRSVGPEFGEDDVWPTAADESRRTAEPEQPVRRSGRVDDGVRRQLGGLSLAFENGGDRNGGVVHRRRERRHAAAAASAPVDVPDWSRLVPVDPAGSDDGSAGGAEWVPPHEYLAREHGRSVTTSVFEGVGRTLKGRDMSRVRDAVWSQTGFFG